MNTTSKQLASRLLYLPLDLHEKVLLWLAYKGLKPVSEITVKRRHKDNKHSSAERINKWIKDANLYKTPETPGSISWHVGKNKDKVRQSAKIIRKFDIKNEYQSGLLFGYPKHSAKAYAINRNLKLGQNHIKVILPGSTFVIAEIRNKFYAPYIFYGISEEYAKKDILVAKRWAECIKNDVPVLAKWFENNAQKQIKKEQKYKFDILEYQRKFNLSIKELLKEYLNVSIQDAFRNIVLDYSAAKLDNFQLSSLSYLLLGELNKADVRDRKLKHIMEIAKDLYEPGKLNIKHEKTGRRILFNWLEQSMSKN